MLVKRGIHLREMFKKEFQTAAANMSKVQSCPMTSSSRAKRFTDIMGHKCIKRLLA